MNLLLHLETLVVAIRFVVRLITACKQSALIKMPSKLELRGVIHFLWLEKKNRSEIYRHVTKTYGSKVISRQAIGKWCKQFENGRSDMTDEYRSGRPTNAVTDEHIMRINELIRENRRITVDEIAYDLNISHGSVHNIIQNRLQYRKVCARWVPRLLTETHKSQRVLAAVKLLERHEEAGDSFLDQIVTGDETWVHYFQPETKRASMEWKHSTSPRTKKPKVVASAGKVMLTLFFDNEGVVLAEFMPKGTTINSAAYCATLKRLRKALKDRRPGKLTRKIVLIHDNATPHSARVTQDLLKKFKWDVWEHPPYSPDLSPCDFHVFGPMKQDLAAERYTNDEEVKTATLQWCKKVGREFFDRGIRKLVPRYEKCRQKFGDYVEK